VQCGHTVHTEYLDSSTIQFTLLMYPVEYLSANVAVFF